MDNTQKVLVTEHMLEVGMKTAEELHMDAYGPEELTALYTAMFEAGAEPIKEEIPYKDRPIAIWHRGDAEAFYASSKEEQEAWNNYANLEASKFQETLDFGETVHGHIGYDRDKNITNWCPPLFFPEWLEKYRNGNKE